MTMRMRLALLASLIATVAAMPAAALTYTVGAGGTYSTIQAAINAVHSDAPTSADTDWRQILQLYDQLIQLSPGPIVELNRVVALAEVQGTEVALATIDTLHDANRHLSRYHLFHAVRADLLKRLGRHGEAAAAYEAAIACSTNQTERDFLHRNLESIADLPLANARSRPD